MTMLPSVLQIDMQVTSFDLRFTYVAESSESFNMNEHVHEISAPVGRVQAELEESVIVAQCQGGPNVQGMFYRPFLLLCCG